MRVLLLVICLTSTAVELRAAGFACAKIVHHVEIFGRACFITCSTRKHSFYVFDDKVLFSVRSSPSTGVEIPLNAGTVSNAVGSGILSDESQVVEAEAVASNSTLIMRIAEKSSKSSLGPLPIKTEIAIIFDASCQSCTVEKYLHKVPAHKSPDGYMYPDQESSYQAYYCKVLK